MAINRRKFMQLAGAALVGTSVDCTVASKRSQPKPDRPSEDVVYAKYVGGSMDGRLRAITHKTLAVTHELAEYGKVVRREPYVHCSVTCDGLERHYLLLNGLAMSDIPYIQQFSNRGAVFMCYGPQMDMAAIKHSRWV